jgi:hypothetical protein
MTKSSINPNGNTCYPEKPTSECLPKTIFPWSIIISSKVVLYRISTELPVSIKIRCILIDFRGFCTKYNSKSFIFLALALRAERVYQLLL